MKERSAKSIIHSLFTNYVAFLRQNGLKWLFDCNQKISVLHFLSEIKPKSLRDHLRSFIDFSFYEMKKYFKRFQDHAIRTSEAFKVVYSGFGAEEYVNIGN